jgi:hypothetical protein
LQNFFSGVPRAIFSKNARILTVIFIGHRQLDNAYFHLPTNTVQMSHLMSVPCSDQIRTSINAFLWLEYNGCIALF